MGLLSVKFVKKYNLYSRFWVADLIFKFQVKFAQMAITSRLSLQGAVIRPLAGELASAVTYCVSNNSASLEPVTCWSGQVGRIRKNARKSIY